MKRMTMIIGLSLLIATFEPFTVTAQQQSSQTSVEQALHSLDLRTAEIVQLLDQLVAQRAEEQSLRRLHIAILALQLRTNAISNIEARIRTLEDRATAAKENVTNLEAEIQRYDEMALDDSTTGETRKQLEFAKTQIEQEIDVASQRATSIEMQILDLQNELIEKRRNVEDLEEIVMEGLGHL